MKIYVASSWKTLRHAEVVEALRKEGYEVYDYREANKAFAFEHLATNPESWPAQMCIDALDCPEATEAYRRDLEALITADVVVGVQPFGASAGMELGWAAGNGRETFLLAADGWPELMSNMLAHRAADLDTLLSMIAGWKLVCDQRNAFRPFTMTSPFIKVEREEQYAGGKQIQEKFIHVSFDTRGPEADACLAELVKLFSKYTRTISEKRPGDSETSDNKLKKSLERAIKILDRPMLKDDFVPNINHAIKVMKDAQEEA